MRLGLVTYSTALLVLTSLGCSGGSSCTPGMSVGCTCVSGGTGAQICDADGTFGACLCPDADGGSPLDAGPLDSGPPRPDAGTVACGEAGALALGAPIMTNMGGSIATVADVEGDERLEIVAFGSDDPVEVRMGTWSGAGLDGPSRQLLDLSASRIQQVAVDASALPVFVVGTISGTTLEHSGFLYRTGSYEMVDVRFLPAPRPAPFWYQVWNGFIDSSGESFARFADTRAVWASDGSGIAAPLYRFRFEADRVSAEQVDRSALFGDDMRYLVGMDGDANGDGIEDFILVTPTHYWITLSAPGDSWNRVTSLSQATCEMTSSGHRFVIPGDLDRDGDLDLILNWNCTASFGAYAVAIQEEGAYTLVHHSLPDAMSDAAVVGVGDLDGDCYPDLLLTNGYVARNDGDARFSDPLRASAELGAGNPTVVDLDLDGDNDIVWASSSYGATGPAVQLNELR